MFKKQEEQKVSSEADKQAKVTPDIKELAQRVLLNKRRVEDQKKAVFKKIDELKKDMTKSTQIKKPVINSFSIDDIEQSVDPKENKQEIAKKIASLTAASELPIYCDKEYMDAIHEYLKAIRPKIVELENKQYEELNLKRQKEAETQNYITKVLSEYHQAENEIIDLLDVIHGLGWLGPHYNKLFKYPMAAKPFTDIIDDALKINDGKRFITYINMH